MKKLTRMVAHSCNQAQGGKFQVQGQPQQLSETVHQKIKSLEMELSAKDLS